MGNAPILARPPRQPVKRSARTPAGFDSVGDGSGSFLDRLGSRLNRFRGLIEFTCTVDKLGAAYLHRSSPFSQSVVEIDVLETLFQTSLIVGARLG